MKPIVPDLLVDSSALYEPLSGVGYYTLNLLKAYSQIPGRYPVKILAYRFFLKPWGGAQERYLAGLAARLGADLELSRRPVPSSAYARLRRAGLRPPFPVDLFRSRQRALYFFPNFVGEALLRSRCVPVIYDFGFVHFPGRLQNKDHLFLKRYLPRTLRLARRIVVISECVKKELQNMYGITPEKIRVLYPAVDHDAFHPGIPDERRLSVRKTYGLDGGYLFSLSTLEPRKNFAGLIEAFARLPLGVRTRFPLVIAGGQGWKNENVFAALRRFGLEGRVRFLGYIPEEDRAPLMREADVFVLPSLYEGFGMPVLEAMACGTPVVTSDRGALPEVGGDAVVYVDPLRPESIAGGILSVLEDEDLRRRLSAEGRDRAQAFQWAQSARGLADVFREAGEEAG